MSVLNTKYSKLIPWNLLCDSFLKGWHISGDCKQTIQIVIKWMRAESPLKQNLNPDITHFFHYKYSARSLNFPKIVTPISLRILPAEASRMRILYGNMTYYSPLTNLFFRCNSLMCPLYKQYTVFAVISSLGEGASRTGST